MIDRRHYTIRSYRDLEEWWDESSLDERERALKPCVPNSCLEEWFSEVDREHQKAAFLHLRFKKLTVDLS